MTLKQWEANRWLRPHETSREEIAGLLDIVDRDLKDAAQKELSADWRFGIAYNAALKLCSILLRASGYRPSHDSHHYRTIQALPLVLGSEQKDDALYLDSCRKKRNIAEYDHTGAASVSEAEELLEFTQGLRNTVIDWLRENHPKLL